MNELYEYFECTRCRRTTITLKDEAAATVKEGGYIACYSCGCKKLILHKCTDDLRECMKARRYKRNSRGAITEIT